MKCLFHLACSLTLLAHPNLDDFVISDNVNLVLLDVTVKDAHAGFVTNLQRSKIRVWEDGRPKEITQCGSVDSPVTVGLVVDNSGSMKSRKAEIIEAGLSFARESNAHDEFFVLNFNNSVHYGLPPQIPFTDKIQTLQRALNYGTPLGQTALYDAISQGLHHLESARQEQRTLIVVSDGGDNVSKISLPELMEQIELSRATIYTIGLIDPENDDLRPRVLRKLAAISGGGYLEPKTLKEVAVAFSQISKDIRHRYTLGFVPDEEHDKRSIRSIKVAAKRGNESFVCKSRTTFRIPNAAGKA